MGVCRGSCSSKCLNDSHFSCHALAFTPTKDVDRARTPTGDLANNARVLARVATARAFSPPGAIDKEGKLES